MKRFDKKLKQAMEDLGLNQKRTAMLLDRSNSTISNWVHGNTIPTEEEQSEIAAALGLPPNYFEVENPALKYRKCGSEIPRLNIAEVAKIMGMAPSVVSKGLQQGVFPWGYAIKTTDKYWAYFINAKRFCEIEGIGI